MIIQNRILFYHTKFTWNIHVTFLARTPRVSKPWNNHRSDCGGSLNFTPQTEGKSVNFHLNFLKTEQLHHLLTTL